MNIRLIATDIDGTILPPGGAVSPATRHVVAQCRLKNIPFVICSGRWYPNAHATALDAGLSGSDYLLAVNGNLIATMDGGVIDENPIPTSEAERIHAMTREDSETLMSFHRNVLYITSRTGFFPRHEGVHGTIGGEEYRCEHLSMAEYERRALKMPLKLEALNRDQQALERMRHRLVAAGLSVSSSCPHNLEIMTQKMGKGHGISRLAEILGIQKSEIMVFGDYTNDLDMFQAAGWPVAVGNAVEELKNAARMIAPRCEEDGVARTIQKYVLGEQ